ncbi:hypothetical protein CC78DRAFT_200559 [Lojkania enalia]|uniref:Arb2 domain-containing protein n=1 Tax=Lojkania enalia TaxID=147567 RepID=A0A9P4KB41_9PLEO|nr:hypothetical protein CC78DRAFT_200559 [Didymosphaeria enalia]
MFRRNERGLPRDASYPADLKKLGYFINTDGHIRMIDYPDKDFLYHFSNNDRHNEVHREAMQICQRQEVMKRLSALGIEKLYLPQLSYGKPDEPHVPILAPPAHILRSRNRVIVIINDNQQDLGILAYRQLQRELGLNGGSIVDFTKELITRSNPSLSATLSKDGAGLEDKEADTPGLIVMNTGQLLFSYKFHTALSTRSWGALPRKSICHSSLIMHEENRVKGNECPKLHIKYVWEHVVCNPEFVDPDAQVYVIAIENGAGLFLKLLNRDWDTFADRLTAFAPIQSNITTSQLPNPLLQTFLHARARQWSVATLSSDPRVCVETPKPLHLNEEKEEADMDMEPICPMFGGGEYGIGECVFTDHCVQKCVLDFFDEVERSPGFFSNPEFVVSGSVHGGTERTFDDKDGVEVEEQVFGWSEEQQLSVEQAEVQYMREQIHRMHDSLRKTPDKDEFSTGRANLQKRIKKAETKLEVLIAKAEIAAKKEGEKAAEQSSVVDGEKWETVDQGPKVEIAGSMVDRELVRGAGLLDIAEEEEEEEGVGG